MAEDDLGTYATYDEVVSFTGGRKRNLTKKGSLESGLKNTFLNTAKSIASAASRTPLVQSYISEAKTLGNQALNVAMNDPTIGSILKDEKVQANLGNLKTQALDSANNFLGKDTVSDVYGVPEQTNTMGGKARKSKKGGCDCGKKTGGGKRSKSKRSKSKGRSKSKSRR